MNFDLKKTSMAIQATMDPMVTNVQRKEAIDYCNSIKNSPQCTNVSLYLVKSSEADHQLKYFGLELLKHQVKIKWTNLSEEEKSEIKQVLMKLIVNISTDVPKYFFSSLSSILTEVVKHTWPQAWPNMLDEVIQNFVLNDNKSSAEIALQMLLSLCEDVYLIEGNVSLNARLKDLKQALSLATDKLIELLTNVLKSYFVQYESNKNLAGTIEVALKTVNGFSEWVRLSSFARDDHLLYKVLSNMLLYDDFKFYAAQCLETITCRKGKPSEKLVLVKLCESSYVEKYQQAASVAANNPDSSNLTFLCKLGELLFNLSSVIADTYSEKCLPNEGIKCLEPYSSLFQLIFWYFSIPSKFVSLMAINSLQTILRNFNLRNNKLVLELAFSVLKAVADKVVTTNEENKFKVLEELEVVDEDHLASYYKKHRIGLQDLCKLCVKRIPEKSVECCLEFAMSKLKDIQNQHYPKADLEMVSFFFENGLPWAVSVIEEEGKTRSLPFMKAKSLLEAYLPIRVKDPLCCQHLLIVVYKLVDMLILSENSSGFVQILLNYVFDILNNGKNDNQRKELRRHACAVLVKLSKFRSSSFVPFLEEFKTISNKLYNENKLTVYENTSLLECLVLISSQFRDNSSIQKQIISEGIRNFESQAIDKNFLNGLASVESFVKACGFSTSSADKSNDLNEKEFRTRIHHNLTLTTSLLKRAKETIKCFNESSDDKLTCLSSEVFESINRCITITSYLSSCWSPNIKHLICKEYHSALEESKSLSKNVLQSVSNTLPYHSYDQTDKNSSAKSDELQTFLYRSSDQCYMFLGVLGPCLRSNFYKLNGIKQIVVSKVLSKIEFIPKSQLKCLMRQFLIDFIKSCPKDYLTDVALPILQDFCVFMVERLQPEWEKYAEKQQSRLQGNHLEYNEDDVKVALEIFEEEQLRVLSREYIDFLLSLSVNKTPPSKPSKASITDKYTESVNALPIAQLTEFGTIIAQTGAGQEIQKTALLALSWSDSVTSCKAATLITPTLKLAFKISTTRLPDDKVKELLVALLKGYNKHGDNVQGEQALFPLIVAVVTRFVESHCFGLKEIFNLAVPQFQNNINKFFDSFEHMNLKKRKFELKKLLNPIVEKHVSERFKEIPGMNKYGAMNVLYQKKKVRHDPDAVNGIALLFQPEK